MDSLFINLLNMSITASWLVLAVVVLRFLLKKAPKWINTVLWAFVGFRLVCPFSFESIFSIIPSTRTIPQDIIYSSSPAIHSGIPALNNTINPIISETFAPDVTSSANPLQIITAIASAVWLLGIIAMVLYAGISYFRLHKKVSEGVVLKDNIWLCDRIDTPFILGIFKPRIFLPSGISESDTEYVIAHERAHLRRRDHWWKPLGFLLLTVYWFNPVMWLAYILLCRDIELACDEKVIKEMGTDIKKSYSEALINCSISRRTVSACPLAFGETGIKDRIKSVLSYKKPTLWVIVIALISCVVVGVCFLTNPESELNESNPELDAAVSQSIFSLNSSGEHYNSECFAEGHIIYGVEEDGDNVDVYLLEQFSGFGFKNGYFMEQTGHIIPAVFTFEKIDNEYILTDCDYAENGTMYENSIKRFFPVQYQARVLDPTEKDYADMWAQCTRYAEAYLEKIGRKAEVLDYSEVPHTMLTDVGITVEVSNKIVTNVSLYKYDSDIGNYETLEDGIRYIHRTDFDKERNVVIFTTEVYKTGDILEKIEVDGKTGEIILSKDYKVTLPEPETDYLQESKDNNLDKLDYTVAAETIKEMPDKYSIQAIHFPKSGESEAAILVGEAYCGVATYFLNHVSWKRCLPPIESLSSPGSVEFVIDEDYRVTVYERKKGSVFAYAVVKYGEEERYYHASYNDYADAVAILHTPESVSEEPVEGFYSYSYITDHDSAYISLNPNTKTAFFSLSSFSDYVIEGTYQDYIDRIFILANDKEHKYVLRWKGDNLIFSADESTPVPEYRYSENSEPAVCIPDGAIFESNGFEQYYIDRITADIDNDGTNESCVLTYGPTSGLFTVVFSAYENGELEYFNIFNCELQSISFGWNEDGKAVIRGTVYRFGSKDVFDDKEYDILIKDRNIVLKSGIEKMEYWGEQGLESPYAPK